MDRNLAFKFNIKSVGNIKNKVWDFFFEYQKLQAANSTVWEDWFLQCCEKSDSDAGGGGVSRVPNFLFQGGTFISSSSTWGYDSVCSAASLSQDLSEDSN